MAESILNFFPGFDVFKLPQPSSDPEVLLNLNRDEVQQDVKKSFFQGVQEFKALLRSKLSPKRSFNDGEYVTGEGRWIPQPSSPYPPSLSPPPSYVMNLLNPCKINWNFLMSFGHQGNGRSALKWPFTAQLKIQSKCIIRSLLDNLFSTKRPWELNWDHFVQGHSCQVRTPFSRLFCDFTLYWK